MISDNENENIDVLHRTLRERDAEIGRLRVDLAFCENQRALHEKFEGNNRIEVVRLRAEIARLEDDVLEHKDAASHLRAALVGRGIDIDALRADKARLKAENAELRDAVKSWERLASTLGIGEPVCGA